MKMSRMPKVDKKPKNNKHNKFRWVDMQWEKFMNRHDEDVKIIDQLREDLITCNKFFQERREQMLKLEQENTKLRIALCNLRDEYLDMGGDPKQLELFENQQMEIFEDVDILNIKKYVCFSYQDYNTYLILLHSLNFHLVMKHLIIVPILLM